MHFKLIMARLGDMKAVVRTKYLIVVLVVTTRDGMAITPKICFDEKNDAFVGVLNGKGPQNLADEKKQSMSGSGGWAAQFEHDVLHAGPDPCSETRPWRRLELLMSCLAGSCSAFEW